jgi:hypothetical protein
VGLGGSESAARLNPSCPQALRADDVEVPVVWADGDGEVGVAWADDDVEVSVAFGNKYPTSACDPRPMEVMERVWFQAPAVT